MGEIQRIVLELKILYSNLDKTIQDGMQQVSQYAQQVGSDDIHLLVFNRDSETSWDEKIFYEEHEQEGRVVHVWGCYS